MHVSGEVSADELDELRRQDGRLTAQDGGDAVEGDYAHEEEHTAPPSYDGGVEYGDYGRDAIRYPQAYDLVDELDEDDFIDEYPDEDDGFSDADYGYAGSDDRGAGRTESWEADSDFDNVDFGEEYDGGYDGDAHVDEYDDSDEISRIYSAEPLNADGLRDVQEKKKKKGHKVAAAVLTVFGVAIIGGGIYGAKTILDMGTVSSTEQVGDVAAVKSGQLGASEEDAAMLKNHGYDAQKLAVKTQDFCTAFFTFSPATIKDGSWEKAFSKYTLDIGEMEISSNENMIATRCRDDWKTMTESHPGFVGKVIGYESLSFGLSEDKLPYCDIVAVVSRPELDRYTTNSPALIIDKALDTYRVVFDKEGQVISVRRLQFRVLEQDSDEQLASADARAVEKSNSEAKKKAEEESKKQKEEEEKAKKEAEEKEKAEKEAEEREKAEKEEQEKAEEESARLAAEEEAAAKKAAEEAAAQKKAEEEAAAQKKAEEEAAAQKKAEEEAAKKAAEEAAAAARNANEATA